MKDKNTWCVYIHTSPSGKAYIGITSQKPERRWRDGTGYLMKDKNGAYHQPAIAHAILKYGWENFQHTIFDTNLSKNQAEKMEKMLIAFWKTNHPCYGYNIQSGGLLGSTFNEESKQRMSEKRRGENHYCYGKPRSEETKKKISESLKGENHPMYGKRLSEEARKKISEYTSGKNNPMYGKRHTEETKEKIRQARLGKNTSPSRAVYCIELDKKWDSMTQAEKETGAWGIYLVLKGERKSAGKHPVTREPLHWVEVFDTETNK